MANQPPRTHHDDSSLSKLRRSGNANIGAIDLLEVPADGSGKSNDGWGDEEMIVRLDCGKISTPESKWCEEWFSRAIPHHVDDGWYQHALDAPRADGE